MKRAQMKRVPVVAVAVVLVCVTLFLAREPLLLALGNFLVVKDDLLPADVIHVISGPDGRTDYAIQLYEQGYGKQILFTGGWCAAIDGTFAERSRQRAIKQGVPGDVVAVDGSWITSTYSEAVRLKEFIAGSQSPIRSVIVVSDPYHMRRARWTYRQVLDSQVSVQMAPVPFDLFPYQRRWWTDEKSRKMVMLEYLKVVYYHVRYELSRGPVREWLASLEQD